MDAIDWNKLPDGFILSNKITDDTIVKITENKGILTTCGQSVEVNVVEYKNKVDSTLNYFAIDAKRGESRSWLPLTKRYWNENC